ncbi:UNVERIFIED_ORG: hypothetical protein ABIC62_004171 [Burkholderia sp. 1595]|uniref:DUF4123 domain-containing protein n=1 Tax=Paraburkholderia terricola TaxID=169427 RepID=A0ABU1LVI7_9BURK|nr:DUF4123 domain-containing protein [Paraburkholderia terricola]MDR6410774.1 hypothetical protein [Paraburkholderia terricola]
MNRMIPPMLPVSEISIPLERGFLLIEPAMLVHVPDLKRFGMRACTPRVLAHREELMPRLLDVESLAADMRETATGYWLDEIQTERPPVVCAWIDSDADVDTLAEHVARYLVGPGTTGQPVFWRYYDPRVLSLTLAIFDTAQRQALLGPIKNWQFAWAGHRWSVPGPGVSPDALDGYVPAWPRPEQWPRVDRSDIAARVLNRLPSVTGDEATHLPAELDRIFCDVVQRGVTMGADDLADYAWHCLQYGAAFEQHPALNEAWPALIGREITWPDVKARLTPGDFQHFGQASRLQTAERIKT